MREKKTGFWETFILFAIVLVIVQTLLEDIAVTAGWTVRVRHFLAFSGLFFDVVFTIEYLVRQTMAAVRRQGLRYFFRERGWIDLLSSVPLLLLNSLPQTLAIVLGSDAAAALPGFANLLKVIKAVRITRILRFVRLIKLFGKIHNTDSVMAQRHVGRLAGLIVMGLIAVLMAGSFLGLQGEDDAPEADRRRILGITARQVWRDALERAGGERRQVRLTLAETEAAVRSLFAAGQVTHVPDRQYLAELLAGAGWCLAVEDWKGTRLFQRIPYEDFRAHFGREDYFTFSELGLTFTVSIFDRHRREALANLLSLALILTVVICLILFYAKHFAQTVSDVVHVMRRGMSEPGYNLQVRINPLFQEDEIYRLAALYNEEWLPLKDRHRPRDAGKTGQTAAGLTLDDFFNNT